MDAGRAAAVCFVLVGVGLLANPLYLHAPSGEGSILLSADRTSPASGAATLAGDTAAVEDLPPVARVAAGRALANGSFSVARDGPPLLLELFAGEWRYLAAGRPGAVYRTTVNVGENATTLTLANVSLGDVTDDLGVTPPEELAESESPKVVFWLAQQSDAVVVTEAFEPTARQHLETAVEAGRVTVANGNDRTAFRPLAGEVRLLADDDRFHRVAVRTAYARVALEVTPVDNRTGLAGTNATVVAAGDLPPDVRGPVLEAITGDGARASHDEVNATRLETVRGRLIRHEGAYYLLRIGHADSFGFVGLLRTALTGLGVVAVLVGLGVGRVAGRD